jgi:hypothetical protein
VKETSPKKANKVNVEIFIQFFRYNKEKSISVQIHYS